MATPAEVAARLRAVAARLADMRPILEVVAADVRTKIDDSFAQSGGPAGEPWPPLAPMTVGVRDVRAARSRARAAGRALREENARRVTAGHRPLSGADAHAFRSGHIEANRRPHKPLLDTGRLRGSITTRVAQKSLLFGTNVVYAAAQHFGNPNNRVFGGPPGPIPARPFLLVGQDGQSLSPADWWRERISTIQEWIITGEVRS